MKSSTIILIVIAALAGIGAMIYFMNQNSMNMIAMIGANKESGQKPYTPTTTSSDPTTADWINSIGGIAEKAGLFSWTQGLFGGKKV